MKASELRIGNLVQTNFKKEKEITDIKLIDFKENFFKLYDPIPLTEEWLLKFGFEMINSSPINYKIYSLKDITFYVIKDSNIELYDKIVYSEQYKHIESVHQLQNLYFALYGEELNIKQQEQ
jgi:hypothetical protein